MRGLPPANRHTILRSCAVAFGLFLTVRVAVPDYPWGGFPFWYDLCYDPNGFWHEVYYIWAGVLSVVALSVWYEWQETLRNFLRVWTAQYDGPRQGQKTKIVRKVASRPNGAHLVHLRRTAPGDSVEDDKGGQPPGG